MSFLPPGAMVSPKEKTLQCDRIHLDQEETIRNSNG